MSILKDFKEDCKAVFRSPVFTGLACISFVANMYLGYRLDKVDYALNTVDVDESYTAIYIEDNFLKSTNHNQTAKNAKNVDYYLAHDEYCTMLFSLDIAKSLNGFSEYEQLEFLQSAKEKNVELVLNCNKHEINIDENKKQIFFEVSDFINKDEWHIVDGNKIKDAISNFMYSRDYPCKTDFEKKFARAYGVKNVLK